MRNRLAENITDLVIERLLEARKAKGMSHDKVADSAGLHRSTISLIESRKREPTLLTCLKIASALGVNLGDIISKSEKTLAKEKG